MYELGPVYRLMMCYYDALPIIQHMAKGNNSHKKEVKKPKKNKKK
jgi:hypothetical protein